jgi:ABC-2 type transport system permease protein
MKTLAKLTWIEVKLFAREPIAVVFAFAFPLVVLLVLAGVFGSEPSPDFGGVAGIDYYVPSYLAVVIASIGLIAGSPCTWPHCGSGASCAACGPPPSPSPACSARRRS